MLCTLYLRTMQPDIGQQRPERPVNGTSPAVLLMHVLCCPSSQDKRESAMSGARSGDLEQAKS